MSNAVVTCNSPYGGLSVTAHYYARWLARAGFRVLFVSTPISPFHLLNIADAGFRKRLKWWSHGLRQEADGITSLVPSAMLTPRDFWPLSLLAVYRNWPVTSCPSLRRQIRKWAGGNVDYLYLEAPIFLPLMDLARPRLSIYRLPDMLGSFHSNLRALSRAAAAIAQKADLTVYASASFSRQVEELQPRASAHLPNGVELEAFLNVPHGREPEDIANLARPRVVFVGEIGNRIDLALISEISLTFPQASIVLIGSISPMIRGIAHKVLAARNVHYLGEKQYGQLAYYLLACDVGIVPFRFDQGDTFIAHSNPLKVYQYLACGLPVVATRTSALESVAAPIDLAATSREFVDMLRERLRVGSTAAERASRQNYSRQHSFEARLDALFRRWPEHDPRKLL